jgi:hypothetical protein
MFPTKNIKLSGEGEAVIRTTLTNRDRIRISGAGNNENIILAGVRVLLMEYNGKTGKDAVESFLDSTNGEDFKAVFDVVSKVVNGIEDSPKGE